MKSEYSIGKKKKAKGKRLPFPPQKRKPIKIDRPFISLDAAELEFIKKQFPEATQEDLDIANKKRPERRVYEHYTSNGKGDTHKIDPKPKDPHFRTKGEGRIVGVMPKRKNVKLKTEIWNGNTLTTLFREQNIHADRTNGWFITFNTPSRVMTPADQLMLMLADGYTEYDVQVNHYYKHLVIDTLEGNLPN